MHFITSIVAPTLAPFQIVRLGEVVRVGSSIATVASDLGRAIPVSKDTTVVPGATGRIGRRVRNRTKVLVVASVIDNNNAPPYQTASEGRDRNSRFFVHRNPAPVLRI
jgi:hypothetical protein